MWKGWRRDAGSCSTMWISWCTCFIPSCGSSTSSSACGATLRWLPRATQAVQARKDKVAMRRTITRLAVFAVLLLSARPLAAQYFGQNRVQYRNFKFQTIQTEHFDVYYYPDERGGALDAARMAERAYARLSRSEEHTSELQSRYVISYAVFCLKKKKKKHSKCFLLSVQLNTK